MTRLISKNWSLDNVETIIFDKDGTFIDLHYFWGKMTEMRANEVIKYYKLKENIFDTLCKFLGYDTKAGKMLSDGITALYSRVKIIEIFTKNLNSLDIKASDTEITNIFDYVSEEFYKSIKKYTKPINDAIEFIKKAHNKKIKLGIVTSDSIKSTQLTLKNYSWGKYFDSVIGRESSEYSKESGIPTKLALDELSADFRTTIMIGDAPMDYISAKNAGIERTILVSTGQISKKELLDTSRYVLSSLSELEILD